MTDAQTFPAAKVRIRYAFLGNSSEIRIGATILVAILALGFVLPRITGYSPSDFVATPSLPPSPAHPFGTDSFGRDVMVRSFAAARVDYLIAGLAVGLAALIGTPIGVFVATTNRRGLDWFVMRIVDAIIAFPIVVLVVTLVVILGADSSFLGLPAGLAPALGAFVLIGWAYYARIARSQALSLRQRDFIAATRYMGYSDTRIVLRHVLPSVVPTILAYAVGDAIITIGFVASLGLLGAGVQPPTAEWGSMIVESRPYIETAWWMTFFPVLLLLITGFALSLVGDGLIKRLEGRGQ
jgi:peptide/nickel transport system permease protein